MGLTPRKSLTLTFPTENQVPIEYLPYFVRGYFEGDGCICIHGNHRPVVTICVTVEFGQKMGAYLSQFVIRFSIRPSRSISVFEIKRYDSICKFYKLIYSSTEPFVLRRKYDKLKKVYDDRLLSPIHNSSSRYAGIHRRGDKWLAQIQIDKRYYRIGLFLSEYEALEAKKSFLAKRNLEC